MSTTAPIKKEQTNGSSETKKGVENHKKAAHHHGQPQNITTRQPSTTKPEIHKKRVRVH